ncbi:MAG TPA: tryptophan synthase subunit alpha [Rhizomicrobium sp.]|nr:tryptophan synthase subunit alpha [Rhizomicrobium sp.]
MSRIQKRFADLKAQNRTAFVPFVTAGDPDFDTSLAIIEELAGAGADLIELGVPFSDPMADGPSVQAASLRALGAGMNLPRVLDMVRRFRKGDAQTPIILMGYYNPIHAYGTARFAKDAGEAGVDGLIVVDLPPEEDEVLRVPALAQGLDVVRFVTPTTNDARLETVLKDATGYLYYVSITGVTGTKSFDENVVRVGVERVRKHTALPVAVGFGIRTPDQARAIAGIADGTVVGSAIVDRIAEGVKNGADKETIVKDVLEFCASLAKSVHAASPAAVVE